MQVINVEILISKSSFASHDDLIPLCRSYLNKKNVKPGTMLSQFEGDDEDDFILSISGINHIIVDECFHFTGDLDYNSNLVKWHIYSLNMLGPQMEDFIDMNNGSVNVATDYILPCSDLFNLWENLIYDDNVKENILNYAETIMAFARRGVNFNVISCNKVILLHGPPGTGKTSLCKALSQKLSVRMKKTYPKSILIEINSHSLFSKWFSESGKLVTKMFERIRDVCEVPNILVCVLIDEVESLAHAREQCVSGNEPSDSFKVVNAVLTQIDNLKRYPNVLLLSTSNIMCAIDVAFVDRADFKQYIGPPSVRAISKIYKTCIEELIRADIINKDANLEDTEFVENLMQISEASVNLSGRMLRKMPLLACAANLTNNHISLKNFMMSMSSAIKNEFAQRKLLNNGVGSKE